MTDYTKSKDADLSKMLGEKKRELQQFGFSLAASAGGSSRATLKKDIARLQTELASRSKA